MAGIEIYADVAKFQEPLDGTYPRRFVKFRLVNEYGNVDPHAAANIATALVMRKAGKLANFGGYVNPGHIANSTMLAKIRDLGFPTDAEIMMDVESWPDKDTGVPLISGNHSAGFTSLANALRTRQQGRPDLVTAYANRHDLTALYPTRPSWLGLTIAGYNTNDPRDEYDECVAWQYTNGTENHTGWPSSSPPFGHCDHNALFVPIPLPEGEDMAFTDWPTADQKALVDAVWAGRLTNPGGSTFTATEWLIKAVAQTDLDDAVAAVLAQAKANGAGISGLSTGLAGAVADLETAIANVKAAIDALEPGTGGGGPLTVSLTGTATPAT